MATVEHNPGFHTNVEHDPGFRTPLFNGYKPHTALGRNGYGIEPRSRLFTVIQHLDALMILVIGGEDDDGFRAMNGRIQHEILSLVTDLVREANELQHVIAFPAPRGPNDGEVSQTVS